MKYFSIFTKNLEKPWKIIENVTKSIRSYTNISTISVEGIKLHTECVKFSTNFYGIFWRRFNNFLFFWINFIQYFELF